MPLFQIVGSAGYKEGLDGMMAFDRYLEHPHQSFKTIHVAGTNGKGSVSHTLASVLQSAGYKVGLFTSPHMRDFRERIRVNGEMVPEEYVVDFVEKHGKMFDVIYPSFFEVCVAMAFDYFRKEKVDVAVVEVGLGGRLDSTNIINPLLSVITNISIDHTGILGDTLEKIASEKAGIIKSGVPVVIGEAELPSVRKVFVDKAASAGAPIHFVDDEFSDVFVSKTGDAISPMLSFWIEGSSFSTPLMGIYQYKNMPTAYLAVRQLRNLGFSISDEQMAHGFANVVSQTHLLGRWQKLSDSPLVICDAGHNEAGVKMVMEQLAKTNCKNLRIVYGVMKDKDVAHMLPLLPKNAIYYFTKASTPRAMSQDTLQQHASQFGLLGKSYQTVAEALEAAKSDSKDGDLVFVGGSSYVVAEIV